MTVLVAASYTAFVGDFQDRAPATDGDRCAALVELVHAWRRFPFLDPKLPAELLPERWAGARAAAVFAELHAGWDERAQLEWDELVAAVRP